jgi:putative Holliday junction resolvase
VLGLDVGEKTIGTAISDENGVMAFPRVTILRKEGWRRDMAAIRELISKNQIREIVVGLPLMMDGSEGIQAKKVGEFVSVLRRSVRIPVIMQDERLSTQEANRVLMQANLNREERKRVVDSIAACLLLQAYLDSRTECEAKSRSVSDSHSSSDLQDSGTREELIEL